MAAGRYLTRCFFTVLLNTRQINYRLHFGEWTHTGTSRWFKSPGTAKGYSAIQHPITDPFNSCLRISSSITNGVFKTRQEKVLITCETSEFISGLMVFDLQKRIQIAHFPTLYFIPGFDGALKTQPPNLLPLPPQKQSKSHPASSPFTGRFRTRVVSPTLLFIIATTSFISNRDSFQVILHLWGILCHLDFRSQKWHCKNIIKYSIAIVKYINISK